MKRSQLWVLACLPLALAACERTPPGEKAAAETMPETTTVATETTAVQGAGQPTDANVAATLSMSDSAEILPSQVAQQKAQNAQVRDYAQMMVRDHGMLEDSLLALTRRIGLTPAPDAMSRQLKTQADSVTRALQAQTGAAFDQAYMQWMVLSHQTALNAVDQQLLPAIQNPELKNAVQQQVRPMIQQHLQQAQQIQSSLGAGGGSPPQ